MTGLVGSPLPNQIVTASRKPRESRAGSFGITVGMERVHVVRRALDALPSALLMSIVAEFDSNIADLVREVLKNRPELFRVEQKAVPLRQILEASSIAEIKDKLFEDEIYEFSRGSHDQQVEYLERNFHIDIRSSWRRWPDYIEIFERRNLVAHGERTFTKRYVDICLKHGHKGSERTLHTPIMLTPDYLRQIVDVLLEFGVLLVFSL